MFKFSLSSQVFNDLIKRLLVSSGSDKTAKIFFVGKQDSLEVFYSSKIDKSESSSLFYEKLQPTTLEGSGTVGLLIDCLYSINIPSHTSDEKYPYCKEVVFTFKPSMLDLSFSIKWNKTSKVNTTTLHFPVLTEEYNVKEFSSLFNLPSNYLKLSGKDLEDANFIVNFIKSDVTSKDSNGVFLKREAGFLSVVATDSSIAARYKVPIKNVEDAASFECILSPIVFNCIKNFISNIEDLQLYLTKTQICLTTPTRSLCAPTMNTEYIINDPEDFFTITAEKVSTLDLKPTINQCSILSKNSKHIYKKLNLTFNGKLTIQTDVDKTDEVPTREIFKEASILVNGDFFVSCCNRMLMIDLNADLFYDDSSCRITLASQDDRLTILMQGLSI